MLFWVTKKQEGTNIFNKVAPLSEGTQDEKGMSQNIFNSHIETENAGTIIIVIIIKDHISPHFLVDLRKYYIKFYVLLSKHKTSTHILVIVLVFTGCYYKVS